MTRLMAVTAALATALMMMATAQAQTAMSADALASRDRLCQYWLGVDTCNPDDVNYRMIEQYDAIIAVHEEGGVDAEVSGPCDPLPIAQTPVCAAKKGLGVLYGHFRALLSVSENAQLVEVAKGEKLAMFHEAEAFVDTCKRYDLKPEQCSIPNLEGRMNAYEQDIQDLHGLHEKSVGAPFAGGVSKANALAVLQFDRQMLVPYLEPAGENEVIAFNRATAAARDPKASKVQRRAAEVERNVLLERLNRATAERTDLESVGAR